MSKSIYKRDKEGFEDFGRITVNRIRKMNSAMKKILLAKREIGIRVADEKGIKSAVNDFFSCVCLYEFSQEKCFSSQNCFASAEYVPGEKALTEWEWETNEIYLEAKLIQRKYKKAINLVVDTVENLLREKYPNNSFFVVASVQFGKNRNINIRIFLNRGEAYISDDLENYKQPVLQDLLNT